MREFPVLGIPSAHTRGTLIPGNPLILGVHPTLKDEGISWDFLGNTGDPYPRKSPHPWGPPYTKRHPHPPPTMRKRININQVA